MTFGSSIIHKCRRQGHPLLEDSTPQVPDLLMQYSLLQRLLRGSVRLGRCG